MMLEPNQVLKDLNQGTYQNQGEFLVEIFSYIKVNYLKRLRLCKVKLAR